MEWRVTEDGGEGPERVGVEESDQMGESSESVGEGQEARRSRASQLVFI